jgi:4-hydroxy-3-methylbut-2-enyl diphosphate reductase
MKITIARHAGFCFGVRRAIDITFKVRQKNPGTRLFTVGPIIHNPQVIDALTRRGIGIINDILDPKLTAGDIAIIRAHGISPEKKSLLKERGVKVIDATCPMVLKVHAIIKKAAKNADAIAIIGDKDHPEMEAHLGVAQGRGRPIQTLEDAQNLAPVNRLAVVAQTTFDVGLFKEILKTLREKAEVIDVYDTICRSTVDRQKEVEDLANDHDTFIVIGGRNSANTKRLSEIAANQNRHVYKVESGEQLSNLDTADMHRVAIIAGASTPQWVIEECIDKLRSIDTHAGMQNALLNIVARSPLCPALGSMGVAMAAFVFCGQGYDWKVLLSTFFLAFASVNPMITVRQFVNWSIATGLSLAFGLIGTGLYGGLLIIGVALLRPLMNTIRMTDVLKSLASLVIFMLVSVIVPLGLTHARIAPGVILLAAFVALQYLGSEILIGLKNSERDAIIGRMSLARYLSEARGILFMEYAIMGLALILFLSFPLKIAPALAYGLLPALFFLAKGIDIYNDHLIFDNRLYTAYVRSLWLIVPFMGILWRFTMM